MTRLMTDEISQPPGETMPPRDDATAMIPPRNDAATAAAPRTDAASTAGSPLLLQARLAPRADGLYYVSEILAYHDEAFVEAAFAAALRRAPDDAERRDALTDLRGGVRAKIEILRDLARSEEGRRLSAFERVAGLRQSALARRVRQLPLVGYLWRVAAAVARLPMMARHQQQFEAYTLAQQQRIADHLNAGERRLADLLGDQSRQNEEALESAVAELRLAVADASAAISMLSDAMAQTVARHGDEQSLLARRLAEAERHLSEHAGRLDAQQQFLIREQQTIVEAQKAALADAEQEWREAVAAQRRELAAVAARVDELRAKAGAARASTGDQV
jgi:hypothetical protein